MKKIITLALALILTLSMAVCAFAEATITEDQGSASADVKGSYVPGDVVGTEVNVGITWNDVTYTYKMGDESWDAEKHEVVPGTGAWGTVEENFKVTVTNNSNTDIDVAYSVEAITGVTIALDKENATLTGWTGNEAEGETPEGFVDVVTVASVTGKLTAQPEDGKIGTITVAISVSQMQ